MRDPHIIMLERNLNEVERDYHRRLREADRYLWIALGVVITLIGLSIVGLITIVNLILI